MIDAATDALVAEQADRVRSLADMLPISAVRRTGTTVIVVFAHPRSGKAYAVRFRCDGYPLQPPSVDFVDPLTERDGGPDVWPAEGEQAIKTTSSPRFVCLPGVREYHERHGPAVAGVHTFSLAKIFHELIQALEARG